MPLRKGARSGCKGVTITEMLVALSLTTLLITATFLLMKSSSATYQRVSAGQDAGGQILKAEGWLRRDLAHTAYQATASADSLSTLAGKDGDALWCLSAVDPVTGQFVRNPDGSPRWQRNILYYSVVAPPPYRTGFSGGGIAEGGYEVSNPHKLLVRKVIDSGAPTSSTAGPQEELLSDISAHLETPVSGIFADPGAESVALVARDILGFRVRRDDTLQSVTIVLQGAKLRDRQLEFPIGSRSLLLPGYLIERRLEVFPENKLLP